MLCITPYQLRQRRNWFNCHVDPVTAKVPSQVPRPFPEDMIPSWLLNKKRNFHPNTCIAKYLSFKAYNNLLWKISIKMKFHVLLGFSNGEGVQKIVCAHCTAHLERGAKSGTLLRLIRCYYSPNVTSSVVTSFRRFTHYYCAWTTML